MKKRCLYCNNLFEKKVNCSLKEWNEKSKFCSQRCYWNSIKGKKTWSSTQKGVHLSPKSEFKKGMKPWNKGIKTGHIPWNKKAKIELVCTQCKKKVYLQPYRVKQFKFCSRRCQAKYNLSGEKHWNFKDWSTNKLIRLRSSQKYKKWRESVMKRDNYTCQKCGQIGGKLEVDHIKPFAYFKELRFDINNGRTLCIGCHKKTDTYLSKSFKYKQSNII